METRSDRLHLPDIFEGVWVRERAGQFVLRIGVHAHDGFVEVLNLLVTDSYRYRVRSSGTSAREVKAELLRKVIEHATVQLATLELERT